MIMQRTSAVLLRPSPGFVVARLARVVVVALIALALVVAGCTVAQSSPSSGLVGPAAAVQATPAASAVNDVTAAQRLLACIPGRDKTRAETNALSPSSAALLHCPAGTWVQTAVRFGAERTTSQRVGRIPAALTHLDLGILRT